MPRLGWRQEVRVGSTCIFSISIIHESARHTDYSDYYSNVNTPDSTYINATTIDYKNRANIKHKVIKCKHGYFDVCSICSSSYNVCASKLSKANGLKIGHINVHSLHPKIDEISFLIKKTFLDILCISETSSILIM